MLEHCLSCNFDIIMRYIDIKKLLQRLKNIMSVSEEQVTAVHDGTDAVFNAVQGGGLACCLNPLLDDIKFKKHQMKLKFRDASCICKPCYLCPWCLAFSITRCNKCCSCCLSQQGNAEKFAQSRGPDNEDYYVCWFQLCYLMFVPLLCTECICLSTVYYGCCMCFSKLEDTDRDKQRQANRTGVSLQNQLQKDGAL